MSWLYYIVFLIVSVAAGYLIAWLSRDELVIGRKWFQGLVIASFIIGVGSFLFGYRSEMLVCLFILIVSWISYLKSKNKKWTKAK